MYSPGSVLSMVAARQHCQKKKTYDYYQYSMNLKNNNINLDYQEKYMNVLMSQKKKIYIIS